MSQDFSRPTTRARRSLLSRRISMGAVGALVCGIAVLTPTPALAAGSTLYVRAGSPCSDTGPGTTPASPFCTIGAAVRAALSGDTVTVASGTYPERVDVGKTLTIVGETGATVDASGVLYGFKLSAADVQLSGFTIQGASSAGVFLSGATNTTVQNVRTTGGDDNGIRVEGARGTRWTKSLSTAAARSASSCAPPTKTGRNSTTRKNGNHGLSIQGGDGNQVSGVTSSGNSRGNRSATGIDVRATCHPARGPGARDQHPRRGQHDLRQRGLRHRDLPGLDLHDGAPQRHL